jgi:hypothetical protein
MEQVLDHLQHNFSHAFAPIFRYKPEHSVQKCNYCLARVKHTSKIYHDKIPLEGQAIALQQPSTKLTRFSLIMGQEEQTENDMIQIYKTWQEVCKHNFKCHVNRLLVAHRDYIWPSRANCESEMKHMFQTLKINDQLLLYVNNQSLLETCLPLLQNACCLWVIGVSPLPKQYLYRYQYDTEKKKLNIWQNRGYENLNPLIRCHFLAVAKDATLSHNMTVLQILVQIMQKFDFRLSVYRLLELWTLEFSNCVPIFFTNYPMNAKTTNFGFG